MLGRLPLALAGLFLVACTTPLQLAARTEGHIGCHRGEITTSNVVSDVGRFTWDASCRGQSFVCAVDGDQVTCAPRVPEAAAPRPTSATN
jgi:hypothetical protein